jgi:hypothetical protein
MNDKEIQQFARLVADRIGHEEQAISEWLGRLKAAGYQCKVSGVEYSIPPGKARWLAKLLFNAGESGSADLD